MSDAPERIWAAPSKKDGWAIAHAGDWPSPGNPQDTSYTRTDIHTAAIAERDALRAEVERLRGALQLYAGGVAAWGVNWEPIDDRGAVARAALGDRNT